MTGNGYKKLKMDNRGSAMITAIVVGVVMIVFALAMLLVTYSLYAQSAKRTGQIQCRYLAEEIADELSSELSDNESELYKVLSAHVYKIRPGDSLHTGTWKAVGVNATEASETLEYDLKTGSDETLKEYEIGVVFSYIQGADDTDDTDEAANDTEYDGTELKKSDLVGDGELYDEYDEIDSNSSAGGGGACTVIMEITCKKGDDVCTITRETEAVL